MSIFDTQQPESRPVPGLSSSYEERIKRNELADVHQVIDMIFNFGETLKKMHPSAENTARTLLRQSF